MAKTNDSEVKSLIMGANLALEAHKFDKAKSICEQALKLDDNNPNIYLILLLAKYKVTEIEHLEKCKVDYELDIYKNVRRYADKELHEELNRYLSDKQTFESYDKPTDFKLNFKNLKPKLKDFLIKVKDFYLDKDGNSDINNGKKSFNNKSNKNNRYSGSPYCGEKIDNILSSDIFSFFKDTVSSLSAFISVLSLIGVIFYLFFITAGCLMDLRITCIIPIGIIDTLLVLIFKKTFNRDFDLNYKPDSGKSVLLGKAFLNFVLAIILVFIIYPLYYESGWLATQNLFFGIGGILLGFIASYLVFWYYRCVYCFFKYISIFFKSFDCFFGR